MKKVILSGTEADVDKIMQENRVRVARGLVSFEVIEDEQKKEPSKASTGKAKKASADIEDSKEL